jgi:hypothetical protein
MDHSNGALKMRVVLAIFFIGAGIMHFVAPDA